MAVPRWPGRGRCDRGHRWSFGVHVPLAERGGGECAVVARSSPGIGHRGHSGHPRTVAGLEMVDSDPSEGHTRGRRIRVDRPRHRRGLCGERSGEAGGGRGAALPCIIHRRRGCHGMPRTGRLVVPEQPRYPGRRVGGRSGCAVASPRRDHAAAGRDRCAVACAGGSALPARCARRRITRRRCGRGRAACVHVACPMGGVTGGAAAEQRSRPRAPRPRQQPGCPPPASPGWNSRGL